MIHFSHPFCHRNRKLTMLREFLKWLCVLLIVLHQLVCHASKANTYIRLSVLTLLTSSCSLL